METESQTDKQTDRQTDKQLCVWCKRYLDQVIRGIETQRVTDQLVVHNAPVNGNCVGGGERCQIFFG